ncbi:MAG: ATPase, T2SS/T4P/T4SS family, partial [bacterium]|nr:ATPase, T2SS/T4P/T4SS family [bacterium]
MRIVDLLIKKKIITEADREDIERDLSLPDSSIDSVLISHGIESKDILAVKGEYLGIPTAVLGSDIIPSNILENVPEETALHYKFVPIAYEDGVLHVGVVDPDNIEARDALQFITSKINIPYKIFLITDSDFVKAIEMYKGLSGEVTKALTELESELSNELEKKEGDKGAKKENSAEKNESFTEDAPVVKIVTTIIRYATDGNASDVHIEPMAEKVRVRFRVDGTLNTSITLPIHIHNAVVARIKVVSNLKLDERRLPQDGRFSVRIDKRKIDFRVSTFPT